jgi:hypothetical protein
MWEGHVAGMGKIKNADPVFVNENKRDHSDDIIKRILRKWWERLLWIYITG